MNKVTNRPEVIVVGRADVEVMQIKNFLQTDGVVGSELRYQPAMLDADEVPAVVGMGRAALVVLGIKDQNVADNRTSTDTQHRDSLSVLDVDESPSVGVVGEASSMVRGVKDISQADNSGSTPADMRPPATALDAD